MISKLPPTLKASLLMLAATLALSLMHAMVRHISESMHTFEIAFFRNLFGLAAALPVLLRAGPGAMRTAQPKLHVIRGLLGIGAMFGWFYGLSVVPLAEATALSFSAAIFGAVAAVILLGERPRIRRWLAIAVGFGGTLIILRPGVQAISAGSLVILFSSLCWGTNLAVVKRLSRTDSTVSIVIWVALLLTILSFLPALWVWQTPDPLQLALLVVIGTLGTIGHFAMTNALRLADATSIIPLDFTRLLWTGLIGYFIFSEIPDRWTWVGGSIIFASSVYITYREVKANRQRNASRTQR